MERNDPGEGGYGTVIWSKPGNPSKSSGTEESWVNNEV